MKLLLLLLIASQALASDPYRSTPTRSLADGADERIHVKHVGNATDATPGAVAQYQQKVHSNGAALVDVDLSTSDLSTETTLSAFKSANHSDFLTVEGKQDTGNASLASILTGQTSGTQKVQGNGTIGAPTGGILTIQGAGGSSASPVIVSGASAVGSTPINNPVPVSGVDGGGLKRAILTDTSGRVEINTIQTMPLPSGAATETSLATRNNLFASLIKFEAAVGQELRADDIVAGDLYHGRATDGTATSTASWEVVRFYRSGTGSVTRTRYRTGVAWDSRTSGW